MSEIRWGSYDSIATGLSTGLNALGSANTAISDAINFAAAGVDKKQFLDIEVILAQVNWSAQVNPAIYIWILARTDGTNYEDGSAGTPGTVPARAPDMIIPIRAADAAQRVFGRLALTTPDYGKILVQNQNRGSFGGDWQHCKILHLRS